MGLSRLSDSSILKKLVSWPQNQDQDSLLWNAETTITHQDLWLGN